MKKLAFILAAAAAILASCTREAPLSIKVVNSEMSRCPEASWIDSQEGNLKWNYTTGLELKSFLDVYDTYGGDDILAYVDAWYDAIIDSTGTIATYSLENYSTDHICPGRALLRLWEINGKPKYRMALDTLYAQLQQQPRTPEGGFWHKKVYPEQMWLDGLYMAQPFYAAYTRAFVTDSIELANNYRDIAEQFELVYDHTLDAETGLLRHAWDSSCEMFWADPETGCSPHAWGRAMGWYAMALVDVIEILPAGEDHDSLVRLLNRVFAAIPLYADAATGMWFQVLDCPYAEGNYLEATCSAMFVYAMLKGTRLGVLDGITSEDAAISYESLLKTFVRVDSDGLVSLDDCCEVAGLGGRDDRSGDYDYYINCPVRSNDPKGIGPLVWASLEYERR